MLTEEEKNFILEILNGISLKPLDKGAPKIVTMVQSIAEKLSAPLSAENAVEVQS